MTRRYPSHKALTLLPHGASALLLAIQLVSCRSHANESADLETSQKPSGAVGEEEPDADKAAKEDQIAAYERDKLASVKAVGELQQAIEAIARELETNKTMSRADRTALEGQLEDAKKQKAEADAQLKSLADKQTQLDREIKEQIKANELLSKEKGATPQVIVVPQQPVASAPTQYGDEVSSEPKETSRYAMTFLSVCLDIKNAARTDGMALLTYPCSYSSNQRFSFEKAGASYRMIAEHSQKCVYVQGASVAENAPLQQLTCKRNGDASELFQFIAPGPNGLKIKNLRSGLCLKIAADNTIVQGSCLNNFSFFKPIEFL